MKRFAFLAFALSLATAAHADISHKIQSSIQLTVDGAASQASRIGSTLSVSGNNVTLGTAPTLSSLTPGSAVSYTPGDWSVTTTGNAFSYNESFIEGDATPTATTVTAGVTPTLPMLGSTTTTAGGVAGSLAGTIASDHAITLTAGGAGTTAIGQIVTELTVK
tara:strand:- start:43 stop:531 length:489 start_codon:yes stop_codon:yes gene_type:complete